MMLQCMQATSSLRLFKKAGNAIIATNRLARMLSPLKIKVKSKDKTGAVYKEVGTKKKEKLKYN